MDFAQHIGSVESKLNSTAVAEALGEALPVVKSALVQMKAEYDSTRSLLHEANEESKGRKIKIRKFEEAQSDFETKIEDLTARTDTSELTEKIKTLEVFKTETIAKAITGFSAEFAKVVEHPNFEKAKTVFNLPKADDKGDFIKDASGNFDFSTLDGLAMEANIAKMTELTELDYFGNGEGGTNENTGDGGMQHRSDSSALARLSDAKTFEEVEAAVD